MSLLLCEMIFDGENQFEILKEMCRFVVSFFKSKLACDTTIEFLFKSQNANNRMNQTLESITWYWTHSQRKQWKLKTCWCSLWLMSEPICYSNTNSFFLDRRHLSSISISTNRTKYVASQGKKCAPIAW